MSKQTTKPYSAEFKERAVKLAVESDQTVAQTARDLGINENTLHTWLSKYHHGGNGTQGQNSEHLYEELKRLKKQYLRHLGRADSLINPPQLSDLGNDLINQNRLRHFRRACQGRYESSPG